MTTQEPQPPPPPPPSSSSPPTQTTESNPLIHDPWTPPQESSLLRALIHYPPKGLHAHFRMLSIRHSLLTSGTIDPESSHTRIPGIWRKLRGLYDLDGLDEREDVGFMGLDEGRWWRDFELADYDDDGDGMGGFEGRMWERRLATRGVGDGSDDDDDDNGSNDGDGDEGVGRDEDGDGGEEMTDEARSSPVASGRGMRSGKRGRVSKLKDEMEVDSPASSGRGSSRRLSKAVSEVGDGDQIMEDADDGEEGSETDEDGSEEVEDEDEKRGGGGTKRGRGARRGGRGRRGRKRG